VYELKCVRSRARQWSAEGSTAAARTSLPAGSELSCTPNCCPVDCTTEGVASATVALQKRSIYQLLF
jgi:hypothetical protein